MPRIQKFLPFSTRKYRSHWMRKQLLMGTLASINNGLLMYMLLNVVSFAAQAQRVEGNKLTCVPGILEPYGDFQTVRIECGGKIEPGSVATGDYNWGTLLADKTHFRSAVMELDQLPDYVTEGEERISLIGTFQRDGRDLPTCQTKRRVSLIRDKVVTVLFNPKTVFKGVDPPVNPPSIPSAPPSHKKKYYDEDEDEKEYENEDEYEGEDEYEDEEEYENEEEYDNYDQEYASVLNEQYDDWQETDAEDAELAAWGDESRQCHPYAVTQKDADKRELASVSATEPQQSRRTKPTRPNKVRAPKNTTRPARPAKRQPATRPRPTRPQKPTKPVTSPQNLRVLVKCKSAPAGGANRGACIVRMRLTVRFSGGLNPNIPRAGWDSALPRNINRVSTAAIGTAQTAGGQAANNLVRDLGFTCRTVAYRDLLNALDTAELNGDQGPDVDTGLCFRGDNVAPATADTFMAAGAPYDADALRKAVRFARYSSAIHGCIPGQTYGDNQRRTWADIASWGGPDPSPRCTSCFKDGINFDDELGGAPFGRETPAVTQRLNSYQDAGIAFTDTAVDADPAIVVLFRATTGDLGGGNGFGQWVSNIGSCLLFASIQNPIPDSTGQANAAAGQVCNGWNSDALDGLYDSLLENVKTRITAVTAAGTSPRIYVIGHSRGGAFAAVFAARLLAEQQAGRLGPYTGPFSLRGQISLYTFGAPRAGSPTFANFLEQRTYERFRVVTRFDPVSYGPNEETIAGASYRHFRPLVLYRDPDTSNPLFPITRRCVLTPLEQLSAGLRRCYASCNSALICSNVDVPAADAVAGVRVPVNTACTRLLDESLGITSVADAPGFADHGTYMGVDVNNAQCSENISVFNAYRGGVACRLGGLLG